MKKNSPAKLPIFFSILLILLLGSFLAFLLSRLVTLDYKQQIVTKLTETDRNLDKSLNAIEKNDDNKKRLMKIKADLAMYYIKEDGSAGLSQPSLSKLCRLLSVYNVILLDPKGKVVTSAAPLPEGLDFTDREPAFLLDVLDTGGVSDVLYFYEDSDDGSFKEIGLISEKADDSHILVIASDLHDIANAAGSSSSWHSMLDRNTVGTNGFTFAVDTEGHFLYFPFDPTVGEGSGYIGKDLEVSIDEAGFRMSDLSDGAFQRMMICGEEYYCGYKYRSSESAWIICALPVMEIYSAVMILFIPLMFATVVVLFTLILSYSMILKEYAGTVKEGKHLRRIYFRKSRALVVFSLLMLLILSLFIHLLYSTAVQETINRQDAQTLVFSLDQEKENQAMIKKRYSQFLLQISGISARIISDDPEPADRSFLKELNGILQTQHILLYDKTGTVVASDTTYKGLTLSKDPEDPSYQFRQLLYGAPYVLPDQPDENYLENPYLFVGSLITDENGDPDGFVQLAFDPAFLSDPLKTTSREYILSTFSGTNASSVFTIDKSTGEYSYSPVSSMIGKDALESGITPKALRDGYVGYITAAGIRYLCDTTASDTDYIFVVTPVSRLSSGNLQTAVLTFLPGLSAMILLYLLLILLSGLSATGDQAMPQDAGRSFRSDDALKRFLKRSFFVFSGAVFVITMLHEKLLPPDSIFQDIIGGAWENGVHLFSVTWCVICICSAGFLTICLNMLLMQLGGSLNSRGKTMVHMLISLLKYAAIIGVTFSCANRMGVHTDTLLASAGILTVVIGLGAQSLTSDVFDGLFIIIEGAFHVGDVVTTEDCRGKVLEIGIRNTRLLDLATNNIKIVNNSSLKKVVNHSLTPECIYISIGVDYDEKLERIEDVIKRELPVMKKNIPLAVEGPDYLGVDSFEDSAVMLKFCIKCKTLDYFQVRRELNRELKLMFDRNGIGIPFTQVVLSEREKP
ncbi:MAG: mechanosensitive ion channel [Lachnospiraceae bacterium]|nr:mechanosensitive ion channel [Lachnospiraceae bacterium]